MQKYRWTPHPELVWVAAQELSHDGGDVVMETKEGETFKIKKDQLKDLEPVQETSLSTLRDNLVLLDEFNQGAIIHQLRERYKKDVIYTWIGTILVSINPFQQLKIYGQRALMEYLQVDSSKMSQLNPHVYGISAIAYQGLCVDKKSQSFIISGESGAGKTEATKLILQHISEGAGSTTGVEQEILQTNPVLEAFGNAKTLRNNNSSRFGKWMEINFDNLNKISGARIVNYLLEKSRVTKQGPGERNYHIFYQLCQADDRDYLQLGDASSFRFLNQSGCVKVDKIDDRQEYADTIQAMAHLNFNEAEIDEVMTIVAGVLHLGNLQIESDKGGEASKIANRDCLDIVSGVLKMDAKVLEKSIVERQVTFGRDVTDIPNKPDQADGARNSICQTLFGRLFDYLVVKMNDKLCLTSDKLSMGILDIFGFEVFETNSFEQFCINYCNEKLQMHFTHHIFKMEQGEYEAEGIDVTKVAFTDNEANINLIEGNPGIIVMLDEECFVPKGTDVTWVNKMHNQFATKGKENPCYAMNRKRRDLSYIMVHYAGEVEYDVAGFLEKNRDQITPSLESGFKTSKLKLVEKLMSPEEMSGGRDAPSSKKKSKKKTLGGQFKKQLNSLLETLRETDPHFIRCIKPNLEKIPNYFNSELILSQMKYAGLFEAIRIRASGYTYRKPTRSFMQAYTVVYNSLNKTGKIAKNELTDESAKKHCTSMLKKLIEEGKLNDDDIKLGHTKVFFRPNMLAALETLKRDAMQGTIIRMQCQARTILAMRQLHVMKIVNNKCKDGLSKRDVGALSEAEGIAEEFGIELFVLKEVATLREFLDAQERVVKLLRDAIASNEIDNLEGAIASAEKINMSSKSKEKEALAQLAKAKESLEFCKKTIEIRKRIDKAITGKQEKELEAAIKEAEAMGVPSDQLSDAKNKLESMGKTGRIMEQLQKVISKKDEVGLEAGLRDAKALQAMPKELQTVYEEGSQILLEYYRKLITDATTTPAGSEAEQVQAVKTALKELSGSIVWSQSADVAQIAKTFLQSSEAADAVQTAFDERRFYALKNLVDKQEPNSAAHEKAKKYLEELSSKEEPFARLRACLQGEFDPAALNTVLCEIEAQGRNEIVEIRIEQVEKARALLANYFDVAIHDAIVAKDDDKVQELVELIRQSFVVQRSKASLRRGERYLSCRANDAELERVMQNPEIFALQSAVKTAKSEFASADMLEKAQLALQELAWRHQEEQTIASQLSVVQPKNTIAFAAALHSAKETLADSDKHVTTLKNASDALVEAYEARVAAVEGSGDGDAAAKLVGEMEASPVSNLCAELIGKAASVAATAGVDIDAGKDAGRQELTAKLDETAAEHTEERAKLDTATAAVSESSARLRQQQESDWERETKKAEAARESRDALIEEARAVAAQDSIPEGAVFAPRKNSIETERPKPSRKPTHVKSSSISEITGDFMLPEAEEPPPPPPPEEEFDPNDQAGFLLTRLRAAIENMSRVNMVTLLQQCRKLNLEGVSDFRVAQQLCYGLSDFEFFDAKLLKSIEMGKFSTVSKMILDADSRKYRSQAVQSAKRFVQQMASATKSHDFQIENARDHTKDYSSYRGRHFIAGYEGLRRQDDFARKGLFVNKELGASMLEFTEEPIHKSLMELKCGGDKKLAKSVRDEAVLLFKDLLYVMKVKVHNYAQSIPSTIITRCVEEPLLRDEFFVQLIKQTTSSGNVSAEVLAFKMMYLCLLHFRPVANEVHLALMTHLSTIATPNVTKFTCFDVVEDIAARCFELLQSEPVEASLSEGVISAFYLHRSERLTIYLDNDVDDLATAARKIAASKSSRMVTSNQATVHIPTIPEGMKALVPFLESDGAISVKDVATEASRQLKLMDVGSIRLTDPPEMETKLDDEGSPPEDAIVLNMVEDIREKAFSKKTKWHITPPKQEISLNVGLVMPPPPPPPMEYEQEQSPPPPPPPAEEEKIAPPSEPVFSVDDILPPSRIAVEARMSMKQPAHHGSMRKKRKTSVKEEAPEDPKQREEAKKEAEAKREALRQKMEERKKLKLQQAEKKAAARKIRK